MDFVYYFFNEIEELENQRRRRLQLRHLRDHSNPFDLPNKFTKLFRLPQYIAQLVIQELQEFAELPERESKIPFHLEVLASLHFYGHGSYQTPVGEALNLAMSQSSISRSIRKVSQIFGNHLLRRYVKFPTTREEIRRGKDRFLDTLNFPGTIGAIDCMHVAIVPPKADINNPAILYYNRKGFYSINVQAICDADMKFININARYPGATHDSAIWEVSTIQRCFHRWFEAGERTTWLIGDSGYPLQPWLMTPIPDAVPGTPEAFYTNRQCQARNVIERTFGVLKQRFRCLLRDRVLHYDHAMGGFIVYACVVLHNICRQHNLPDIVNEVPNNDGGEDGNDQNEGNPVFNRIVPGGGMNFLEEGRLIRRRLINMINN